MLVNGPMVGAAQRNGEFIADPAPHGSRLHEPQMVSVRRLPSAQKARLRRHELQMGAIAIAARSPAPPPPIKRISCEEVSTAFSEPAFHVKPALNTLTLGVSRYEPDF